MTTETVRIIRLSILGSVAVLPILILPGMVGALVVYTGFSQAEAGWLVAAGFTGSALGAIVVGLRIRHLDPRMLATVGLVLLTVFDAASGLVSHIPVWLFVVFRFISGLGGAVAYAAVMASIAATEHPERGFGTFMVFQFGLSSISLYGLPYVLPTIGVVGMYLVLAVAAVLSMLLRGSCVHRAAITDEPAVELHMLLRPAALLVMLGIGLYETANFMHYTYAERIGVGFSLSNFEIGETLGLATLLGVPAGLAVVWIGDRFGQLKPLLGAVVVSVVALAWLLAPTGPETYVVAMCALGISWAFGLAYFYAIEARLDPGGSVVVVGGFFTAGGSAVGPAMAAMLVQPDNFDYVLLVAIGVYLAVALLAAASVRFADRN
jgi:MFS family permease